MSLEVDIINLKKNISNIEIINKKVSSVSVGRHIDHCLIVIRDIIQQIIDSDPKNYKRTFNLGRIIILNTGFIPRGRAKAPDFTIPQKITKEEIYLHIKQIEEILPIFNKIQDKNKYFVHPLFGMLNLKDSKRNLEIHTNHNLKIIKDILK